MPARCWIDEGAYRDLFAEADRWLVRETGGALLGWRDEDEAVISRVLGPGPQAKHRFRSFEPDPAWHRTETQKTYRESERKVSYIGDWHTHPIAPPVPSRQDRAAASTIAQDPDFRARQPLSAIMGRSRRVPRGPWRLAVYVWVNEEFLPMEIERCQLSR